MQKENGSDSVTREEGEGVGRMYVVESSGPHTAKGHIVSLDNLHWIARPDRPLAYAQSVGRVHRHRPDHDKRRAP
jgi:hypothetical protein